MERKRPEIIDTKTIMNDYKLGKHDVYRILKHEKCPIITGSRKGEKILIERSAFEDFCFRGIRE